MEANTGKSVPDYYMVDIDGIPFRVPSQGLPRGRVEAAARDIWANKRTPEQREAAALNRTDELRELGIDLDRNYATEGMGILEKQRGGVGRSLTKLDRGIQQRLTSSRNPSKLVDLQRQEADERETYALLDSETVGLGAEDFGELLPDLALFAGGGGLGGLAVRGAALGASQATTEGESVTLNTVLGSLGAVAGAAPAKIVGPAISRMFNKSATFSAAEASGLVSLTKNLKNPSQLPGAISKFFNQAQAAEQARNQAVETVGKALLPRAQNMLQQMNTVGKQAVMKYDLNQLLQKSTIVSKDGNNVLNMGEFLRGVENYSRGKLTKDLIQSAGMKTDTFRTTLKSVAEALAKDTPGMPPVSYETTVSVLTSVMDDPAARAVAIQLGKKPKESTAQALTRQLIKFAENSAAAAGEKAAVEADLPF